MKRLKASSPGVAQKIITVFFLFLFLMICVPLKVWAQHTDSLRTGYMLDAAEEYCGKNQTICYNTMLVSIALGKYVKI